MLIPYKVDVQSSRKPFANYMVMIGLVAAFALQPSSSQPIERFVLDGWSVAGLFGHMWQHIGYLHIIGNLMFLWVFGNAVCAKVGNVLYLPVYIGTGLVAAVVHLFFDDRVTAGASGAIFGIIGTYFLLFPFNSIKCLFWFFVYVRRISVAGFWIILLWVVWDVLGAISGYTEGAAYFGHIGGFVGGAILAIILLKTKLVARDSMDDAIARSLKI